ncbi:hypothetical protein KIPB_000822 [Kipferlia bialata]|uniref:Uncharacterized protein n=1 Tax=Kipferlia bialata TaxID=797122 RepID=A0A9K3GET4_9EUKA|nr:hypothetical protein KIPB_000822 [Kipferlia bialata]|eukprot:g822.t1
MRLLPGLTELVEAKVTEAKERFRDEHYVEYPDTDSEDQEEREYPCTDPIMYLNSCGLAPSSNCVQLEVGECGMIKICLPSRAISVYGDGGDSDYEVAMQGRVFFQVGIIGVPDLDSCDRAPVSQYGVSEGNGPDLEALMAAKKHLEKYLTDLGLSPLWSTAARL